MSIYTRRGDSGETSLADGSRVPKDSQRLEAYGALDELCSIIGIARSAIADPGLDGAVSWAQQRLFNCSASLAGAKSGAPVSAEDVNALEGAIDHFESATGPLRSFIVQSGSESAVLLQAARAVARRAERRIVALSHTEKVDPVVMAFVNRLSDFLFAAARYANHLAGEVEAEWDPSAPAPRF